MRMKKQPKSSEQHGTTTRTHIENHDSTSSEVSLRFSRTDTSSSGLANAENCTMEGSPPRGDPPLKEIYVQENPPRHLGPRRLFFFAFSMWMFEILVVIGLKHVGLLEKEFRLDNVVTQTVLPRINESIPTGYLTQEKKRPGYLLAQQGARAKYPVMMVPGFVTSGLEIWTGHECAKRFFRQRFWAALAGARSFLSDKDCWREHMKLDPYTGLDPDGIRVRASQGFEAADYFLGNYWVWGKLIENLADLGYTPSNMSMMPYDWRLSFPMLEKRDGYLTQLKHSIEAMHKSTGKKVVLTSHSMGALLVQYFFAWVTLSEKQGGGGGGKRWVEDHIHAYVNIAGVHLGVPKAATALLSGEMSDTVMTGTMGNMAEQFFGRQKRRDLWTTWGSLWTMLPKGGSDIWGIGADLNCKETEEDNQDPFCRTDSISPLLSIKMTPMTGDVCPTDETLRASFKGSMLVEDVLDFLEKYGAGRGPHTAASRDFSLYGDEKSSERTWHDPTRTPLPYAPSMKMYCFYGVGASTERAYYYKFNEGSEALDKIGKADPPVVLDPEVQDTARNTEFGIRYADGDGSVPLVSLGYMCNDAWRRKSAGLNPSRIKVTSREYVHRPEFSVEDPIRGGPGSADHVDILGNAKMTEDLLRVVSDFGVEETEEDQVFSNIVAISEAINSKAGIHRKYRRSLSLFGNK